MKYVKEKNKLMISPPDRTAIMKPLLLLIFTALLLLVGMASGGQAQNINKLAAVGKVNESVISNLTPSAAGKNDTLHIHFLSGCKEYDSEHSLKQLKQSLEQEFNKVKVTASWGQDSGKNLPNIEELADTDLLVVFTRRMTVPIDQMLYIFRYLGAEKPIIGIRTASHAFQNYLYFDNQVFGGDYQHHGPDEPVKVTVAKNINEHPSSILQGVSNTWTRPGKLYRNPDLGPHTQMLLIGKGLKSGIREPLAWTNIYGEKGRTFYTSMGQPTDFKDRNFLRLLFNAMNWATDQKLYTNHKKSSGQSY